jgi:phage terminase large subunit-like protein
MQPSHEPSAPSQSAPSQMGRDRLMTPSGWAGNLLNVLSSELENCSHAELLEVLAPLLPPASADRSRLLHSWPLSARIDQLAPQLLADTPWRTWVIMGGRGAGKTRAGAEWIRHLALRHDCDDGTAATPLPPRRIALVAETLGDARRVMVEGVSGLLSVHTDHERPLYEPSKNQITWANGTIAHLFSGEDPDALRGPQFEFAWCDEIAKWRRADDAWDMLQFGLRLGQLPRALVTTTPRAVALLQRLLADPATVITRTRTIDNSANLAGSFITEMQRRYAGSALGRQELDGELLTESAGALWRRDWIEQARITERPELARIVVAVDPPVTANANSDACGIVVAGKGIDGRAYVLADRTIQGRSPEIWARAAVAAYRDFGADRIVAEVNQGGDMVPLTLRQVDANVPITQVRATRGKWLRAEPVAALYAEGRAIHVGPFPELEQQMLRFGTGAPGQARSPDRLDALVWALTNLMLDYEPQPNIRRL